MVHLEPIQQEDFERSRKEFEHYLPSGRYSKDQYIYSIIDQDRNKVVVLWVQVKHQDALIFDFVIEEAFRGKGYGKQALAAMEEKLKSMSVAVTLQPKNCIRRWGFSSLISR